MPMATNEGYFSGIVRYYGDNDFIIQTFDFIASLRCHVCDLQVVAKLITDSRMTNSITCDLQCLMRIFLCDLQ